MEVFERLKQGRVEGYQNRKECSSSPGARQVRVDKCARTLSVGREERKH